MKTSRAIQEILKIIPPGFPRPFDFLQKGTPIRKGLQAVSMLENPGLDQESNLLLKAALYLYFDGFEEAHSIAQNHEGVGGNWVHALLHRREPDASNSRYWYRRTSIPRPLSGEIGREVLGLLEQKPVPELEKLKKKVAASKLWEPEIFVGLADPYVKEDPASPVYHLLARIQEAEWRGLLKHLLGF
jgi:hypothetical protein